MRWEEPLHLDSDDQALEQGRQQLHRQAVKVGAHGLRQYADELACLAGHCRPPASHQAHRMVRMYFQCQGPCCSEEQVSLLKGGICAWEWLLAFLVYGWREYHAVTGTAANVYGFVFVQ